MKQIYEAAKKDQILYYFKTQWSVLLAVTISGLIYNLGLLAGPWFEGQMTGCLVDILGGKAGYRRSCTAAWCTEAVPNWKKRVSEM